MDIEVNREQNDHNIHAFIHILADNTNATNPVGVYFATSTVYAFTYKPSTYISLLLHLNRNRDVWNIIMLSVPLQHILFWHDIAYSNSSTKKNKSHKMKSPKLPDASY